MKHRSVRLYILTLALTVMLAAASYLNAQMLSPLPVSNNGNKVHILPPPEEALQRQSQSAGGPVVYHGGPVMLGPPAYTNFPPVVTTYAIFWIPKSGLLQDGKTKTILPPFYRSIQKTLLEEYPGHGIDNNNTQYYSVVPSQPVEYVQNNGGLAGYYVDTSEYPKGLCNNPLTGANCIPDSEIQYHIGLAITAENWPLFPGGGDGLDKMFLLFTSSGEGSCVQDGSPGDSCAYLAPPGGMAYCGYHSYQLYYPGQWVIYGNEPYLDQPMCQAGTTPNNDSAADAAASVATHELTEAITDPLLTAWYTAGGDEIGDLCAWNYGANSWDFDPKSGQYLANQMWGGALFELQMMYDNHTSSCVQVGP
ncbi:MAG: hypothetical protein WBW69_17805 [Candidatus Korobacteraceae bacterium]